MQISSMNTPTNTAVNDIDFTERNYLHLLCKCLSKFDFIKFSEIEKSENFILLRHDVDFSLSRALQLAKIESHLGILSTYFIDIHSKYYNIFERTQFEKIKEIVDLGHDIGLHFDASFYEITDESDLVTYLEIEKNILSNFLNVSVDAFSFHNPVTSTLKCEKEYYAGMRNCYGAKIKKIKYCSDSNGYWRFDRLEDLVNNEAYASLHINLHPGWWQKHAAPPREKVFRTIFGRAEANLLSYDQGLNSFGRLNQMGDYAALFEVRDLLNANFNILDYLWNTRSYRILLRELVFILNDFKNCLDENLSRVGEGLGDDGSVNPRVRISDDCRFLKLVHTLVEKNSHEIQDIYKKIECFNSSSIENKSDAVCNEEKSKQSCVEICEFIKWIENICLTEID